MEREVSAISKALKPTVPFELRNCTYCKPLHTGSKFVLLPDCPHLICKRKFLNKYRKSKISEPFKFLCKECNRTLLVSDWIETSTRLEHNSIEKKDEFKRQKELSKTQIKMLMDRGVDVVINRELDCSSNYFCSVNMANLKSETNLKFFTLIQQEVKALLLFDPNAGLTNKKAINYMEALNELNDMYMKIMAKLDAKESELSSFNSELNYIVKVPGQQNFSKKAGFVIQKYQRLKELDCVLTMLNVELQFCYDALIKTAESMDLEAEQSLLWTFNLIP